MQTSVERNTIEALAEEFSARLRRGERPSVEEYVGRSRKRAQEIRELFPAVAALVEAAEPTGDPLVRPRRAAHDLAAGERLGEYRVVRELGRGGMGVVYEAIQEPLGRRVALKLMSHQGPLLSTQKERFRREAQAAARLHHTNIVPVFDCGEQDGVPFYAMQYIDGRGLDDVLLDMGRSCSASPVADGADDTRVIAPPIVPCEFTSHDSGSLAGTGALYWQGVARIGLQVADALAYAHRAGVLHRDIKPANLLLDTSGRVWVTDFGLAKASDQKDLTATGSVLGTLRYIAPEALSGKSDAKSDVCSLGLTLYELVALRPAYDQPDRAQLLDALAHKAPPPLARIRPDVPRDLETVIHKAIDRLPAARYTSAAELADDLRRFLAGEPVQARKISLAARTLRWSRRNPVVACLAATVIVLLVAGFFAATLASLRFRSLAEARREALNIAANQKDKAVNAARLAQWAQIAEAAARQTSGLPGQRVDGLNAIRKAVGLLGRSHVSEGERLTLRNLAIASLSLPDLTVTEEWKALPIDDTPFDFTASLDRYATYVVENGRHWVVVRRTSDHQELHRVRVQGEVWPVRLSPDGRYVLVGYMDRDHRHIFVWDTEQRTWIIKNVLCGVASQAVDFRSDSRQLAVCTTQGGVTIYDLPTGEVDRVRSAGHAAFVASYSPDGRRLAVARLDADAIEIFDRESDIPEHTLAFGVESGFVDAMAWNSTGAFLAAGSEKTIYLWQTRAACEPLVLKGHHARVRRLQFHPHLPLLFSSGWDQQIRIWEPMGRGLLLQAEGVLGKLDIAGERAVIRRGTQLAVCSVEVPQCYGSFLNAPSDKDFLNYLRDARMHPGGRLIATCGDWGVCFMDARDAARLAHLECGAVYRVWFGPSGSDLFYSGSQGLYRLPIQTHEKDGAMDLKIGPAERITLPVEGHHPHHFVLDAQGKTLAAEMAYGQIVVLDLEGRRTPTVIRGDVNLMFVDLSPDGRWVVTGNYHGTRMEIFDAQTGRSVKQIAGNRTLGAFSPDGRTLVLSGFKSLRALEVGTWRELDLDAPRGAPVSGYPCFSPGSEAVAVGARGRQIMLFEPRTGRHLATFAAAREASSVVASQYTSDGEYLLTRAGDSAVGVWNVPKLRSSLAELGLDWDKDAMPSMR